MLNLGFAMCGSFCTFKKVIPIMAKLKSDGFNVVPIMSETAFTTDTRFGSAKDFADEITEITGNDIISTLSKAEPIGPKKLLDLLIIAPTTGNTLGKMANGITDTTVTLAAKAHLRNRRPVVIAVSTNDALGATAKNIGLLMNCKYIYFVPMRQDDCINKPNSIVADFEKIPITVLDAFKRQTDRARNNIVKPHKEKNGTTKISAFVKYRVRIFFRQKTDRKIFTARFLRDLIRKNTV